MTSPFFLNYINTPRRPRSQRRRRRAPNPVGQQHSLPSPEPVPIPVRFVGSETDRSEAATKIQKLFRSFTVRKNVKKIAKSKFQVEEIHSQILHKFDLIARDAKERLRLSEKLMSLLFRLDSVSGIDPAVRDCRKAVIRRAVALQEALDTITIFDKQETETETETASDFVDQTLETEVVVETNRDDCSDLESQTLEGVHVQDPSGSEAVVDDCKNTFFTVDDQALEIAYTDEKRIEKPKEGNQQNLESKCTEKEKMKEEVSVEGRIEEEKAEEEDEVVRSVEESKGVKEEEEEEEEEEEVVEKVREENEKKGMVEENEKMKGMVEELCEWNAVQSRLIEALSQRVEKLEKTVARSERLRKKKRMLVRWIV